MNATSWITIAFALPFWWGMSLLALALLGDVSSGWRPRVLRLFDRLDRMGRMPAESLAPSPEYGT